MQTAAFRPGPSSSSQRPGIVWLIYGLALVKFVLPFLLQHPVYEPHRDEFLYLAEGRHPAWGYVEAPPLLSVLSWCSNALGGGFFWIKFWPALFGAMTYVLVARMILLLGGGRFALVMGFLPFVFGFFLQLHFMLTPGFPGVYFQLLMIYGIVYYVRTGRVLGLYWTGIGFGLGMLSQYTTLLFAAWLVMGLLLTPSRTVLRNRHFYFAFLAGFFLFLPNLIWQAMHGWPGVSKPAEPFLVDTTVFVRDQLCFNLPGIIIWGAGLYRVFRNAELRFVGWLVVGVLVTLGVFREDAGQAMGVYPTLFAFGGVALERVMGLRRRVFRVGLMGFTLVTGSIMNIIFLPMLPPRELAAYYSWNPVFRQLGYLRWPDGRDHALPADFAAMLGWEEMAMKAARAYESLDSLEKTSVIVKSGKHNVESGALEYYGPKYSLPPVMARGGEVFILTTPDRREMQDFATAVIVDSVTHPYSAEYGSYIILGRGVKPVNAGNQVAHIRR
jgi:hypothetical protein